MSLPLASKPVHPGPQHETVTQLSGRWLVLARVLWVSLVALILAVVVLIFPGFIAFEAAHLHQKLSYSAGNYFVYTIILTFISMLMCFAVAVVIFCRKSNDWRALLVALMLVMISTTYVTNELQNTDSPWDVPAQIINILAFAVLFLVFSLFPDGRFVPRWTGLLPAIWILWGTVFTVFRGIPSSLHTLIWVCALTCVVVAQVYRYRYVSSRIQCQQTKWVVFGVSMAVLVVIAVAVAVPQLIFPPLVKSGQLYLLIKTIGYTFALLMGSLSFGIAILHSRLWDIDVLINRTLVYSLLTFTLALIYFSVVIVLQFLLRSLLSQMNDVAIISSTLVIVVLFQPLLHRIQRTIDRRFYRRKYDAARTLRAFSLTLRQEVDLAQLSEQLVAVVEETMQPAHVSLWLRKPQQVIIDKPRHEVNR